MEIIAHGGAGKTSLAEACSLPPASRLGREDDRRHSIRQLRTEEVERQIT